MSKRLESFASKNWFSDYDERIEFTLSCPVCAAENRINISWSETRPGIGDNEDVRQRSFFPLSVEKRIELGCSNCNTSLTVYLACGWGGRHGEMQCDIAGLRHGRTTIF